MPITAVYAGLLAILFVALSIRVISVRRGQRISLGDGGNTELLKRVRAHGNFAEYAPLAVLLLALCESLRAPPLLLHALGAAHLLGRCAHAYAVSSSPPVMPFRVGGMLLTFIPMLILAGTCLWLGLSR